MFQGTHALSLDAKGRLAIPARHREELRSVSGGALVVTAHPHRCLLIYPESAWEPIRARVLRGSSLDPQWAFLRRLLIGHAKDEELDAAGRILIAQELRDHAGLQKDVQLVGQGDHFELWSDEGWKAQQKAILDLGAKLLPAGMEDLPL